MFLLPIFKKYFPTPFEHRYYDVATLHTQKAFVQTPLGLDIEATLLLLFATAFAVMD